MAYHKTKLSELYLIGENGWWLGLCTLGEPSFIIRQDFLHPYILRYPDDAISCKKTGWDCDLCSHSWSITNTTWNVYFSTSPVDIFLSKEPQFVFQIFSGWSLCVSVIFSVFHLPAVSEAYCFAVVNNVRNRETRVTYEHIPCGSNALTKNLWRDRLRALSTLKLLPTRWPSVLIFSQRPKVKVW